MKAFYFVDEIIVSAQIAGDLLHNIPYLYTTMQHITECTQQTLRVGDLLRVVAGRLGLCRWLPMQMSLRTFCSLEFKIFTQK